MPMHAAAAADCCDHPECERRFDDIDRRLDAFEKRLDGQDERWERVLESVHKVETAVANLNGRIAGYLVAATLLGTVVAFVAQRVLGH
jgi:hypothetical protein